MESNLPSISEMKESENIQTLESAGEHQTTHETSFDVQPTAAAIAKPRLSLLQSFDPIYNKSLLEANKCDVEGIITNLAIENVSDSESLTLADGNNDLPQSFDFAHADEIPLTPHGESVGKLVDISVISENSITTTPQSEGSLQKSFIEDHSKTEDRGVSLSPDHLPRFRQLVIDESESDLSSSRLETGEKTLSEESDIEFEDAVQFTEEKHLVIDDSYGDNVSSDYPLKDHSKNEASLKISLPEVVANTEVAASIKDTPATENTEITGFISEQVNSETSSPEQESTDSYFNKTNFEDTVVCNITENSSAVITTTSPKSVENTDVSAINSINSFTTGVENLSSIQNKTTSESSLHVPTATVLNDSQVEVNVLPDLAPIEQSPESLKDEESTTLPGESASNPGESASTGQLSDSLKTSKSATLQVESVSTEQLSEPTTTEDSAALQVESVSAEQLSEPATTEESAILQVESFSAGQFSEPATTEDSATLQGESVSANQLSEPSTTKESATLLGEPVSAEQSAKPATTEESAKLQVESVSTEQLSEPTTEESAKLQGESVSAEQLSESATTEESATESVSTKQLFKPATTEESTGLPVESVLTEQVSEVVNTKEPSTSPVKSVSVEQFSEPPKLEVSGTLLVESVSTEQLSETLEGDETLTLPVELVTNSEQSTEVLNKSDSSYTDQTFGTPEGEGADEKRVETEKSPVASDCGSQNSQIDENSVIPIELNAGKESVISNSALEETSVCEIKENTILQEEKSPKQERSSKRDSAGQYFNKIKDFLTSVVGPKRELSPDLESDNSRVTTPNLSPKENLKNTPVNIVSKLPSQETVPSAKEEQLSRNVSQEELNIDIIASGKNPSSKEDTSSNELFQSHLEEAASSIQKEQSPRKICQEEFSQEVAKENLPVSLELKTESRVFKEVGKESSEGIVSDSNNYEKVEDNSSLPSCATPRRETSQPLLLVDGNACSIGQKSIEKDLSLVNKSQDSASPLTDDTHIIEKNDILDTKKDTGISVSISCVDSVIPVESVIQQGEESSDQIVDEADNIIKLEEKSTESCNVAENVTDSVSLDVESHDEVKVSKNLQNQSIKNITSENKDPLPSKETCLETTVEVDSPRRSEVYVNIGKFVPATRNTRSLSPKIKANINRGRSESPLARGADRIKETAPFFKKDSLESNRNVDEVKLDSVNNNKQDFDKQNTLEYSTLSSRDVNVKPSTPRRSFLKEKSPKSQLLGFNQLIDRELIPSPIRNILDCVPIEDNFEDEKENKEGASKTQAVKYKMSDLMDKLSSLHQEISDLKLQLNASQQEKASLELEIRQKEEVIIKTQAEALKKEQDYIHDIKGLKEQLAEKSKLIEKDSTREIELELKRAKAREAEVLSELNARNNDELNFKKIMEEYEKNISARLADFQKLKAEHETATKHLANLEFAFADVHQKYERSKAIIEGFKINEETLRHNLSVLEQTVKHHEEKYDSLKAHAKAQIEKSNKEIIVLRDRYESENGKLNAVIKRLEIKCAALEVSLEQKIQECTALAALCDEVTGKRV